MKTWLVIFGIYVAFFGLLYFDRICRRLCDLPFLCVVFLIWAGISIYCYLLAERKNSNFPKNLPLHLEAVVNFIIAVFPATFIGLVLFFVLIMTGIAVDPF
jgi:predicted tellurium resistance membrane protein TerC